MDFQTRVLLGMVAVVAVAFVALILWVIIVPDEKRLHNRWEDDVD